MTAAESLLANDSERQKAIGQRTMSKLAWRIIPFLCLLYLFNILDRINIGFARTTMQEETSLGLTQKVIDWGFGLFYVGYLVFEVPSNLILRRVGARLWIARIMVSWGLVSTATMWVSGPASFYLVRILLGIAEAGFFPGIVLYLTCWFPQRFRAQAMSWFMIGNTMASIFGNPISGAILEYFHDVGGLKGWQWLFLLEGIPTILLGCLVPYVLQDKPRDAHWLGDEEKDWLEQELENEADHRTQTGGSVHLSAMLDGRILLLIFLYATVALGTNGMGAYLPTLVRERFDPAASTIATNSTQSIKSIDLTKVVPSSDVLDKADAATAVPETPTKKVGSSRGLFLIGILSALPHLSALIAMVVLGRLSDRTKKRSAWVAGAALLASVGWLGAAQATSPTVALVCLCLAQAGMMTILPIFWTIPPMFLGGNAAAGGIALINSVANIGGIFSATLLGQFGPMAMCLIMVFGVPMAILTGLFIERPHRIRTGDGSHS